MQGRSSKEHEIDVLTSVFRDSKSFFEELGYIDYVYITRRGKGIPDGLFCKGSETIWVEHTQARLNYGMKGSLLPGNDGLCNDVQRVFLKEGLKGCICFDVPSSFADQYFQSQSFRKQVLNVVRQVVCSSEDYFDSARNIHIKYCTPKECFLKSLDEYKGLRVIVSQLNNIELCRVIERGIFEKCVSIKEHKYKDNENTRTANWLFIEQPWGYLFRNDLPSRSKYFDKIFTVELDFKNDKECYIPTLVATKESPSVYNQE